MGKFGKFFINFLKVVYNPITEIHEYDMNFPPHIESEADRENHLKEHTYYIGHVWSSDFKKVFLPFQVTDLSFVSMNGEVESETKLSYEGKKLISECRDFWSVFFDCIVKALNYEKINDNYYNRSASITLLDDLEVWPGFGAIITEHEGNVMMLYLNFDALIFDKLPVIERIETIRKIYPKNFKSKIKDLLIGRDVLVKTDNMVYRITDVEFPKASNEIHSYILKASRDEETAKTIQPENCYLTETEHPQLELQKLNDVVRKIPQDANSNEKVQTMLGTFGLKLSMHHQKLTGRWLGEEMIYFGKNEHVNAGPNAKFSCGDHALFDAVNIRNWLLVYCKRNATEAKVFLEKYVATAKSMGVHVDPKPDIEELDNDDTGTYVDGFRRNMEHSNYQVVVAIFPSFLKERYVTLKKMFCSEFPIPSKLISARTLRTSTDLDLYQKLAHRINCNLGGASWRVDIPMEDFMVCGTHMSFSTEGFPVYALVASSNSTVTKWFNKAIIQNTGGKLCNPLSFCLKPALKEYKAKNGKFPGRLIMFRNRKDVESTEEIEPWTAGEVSQIGKVCHQLDRNYNPDVTYIVVRKNAYTKLITGWTENETNSGPGNVATITNTGGHIHEYLLISHNAEEERTSVSPTNYAVVHHSGALDFEWIESLTYKLCFLDYGQAGTIHVPVCCKYAQELTSLVQTTIKIEPSEMLCDKLFYV